MSLSSFLKLSSEEKNNLLNSVDNLTGRLEELVERFYFHFLNDNTVISELFRNSDMVKQHNMFNVSMGVIITNIENPGLIQDHLDGLINRHLMYGIKTDHVGYFTEALAKTIAEIFGTENSIMKAWLKVIYQSMEYFKSKL